MIHMRLAHIAKKQITHKGCVGGGLMSSAENADKRVIWRRFASHEMKRQKQ